MGVVALLALVVAGLLVREVLAASQGTPKMREIAKSIQEGAAAYLQRQFKTIGVFVVLIFFVLLVLPADGESVRWGRSLFFLVGAVFSGLIGFRACRWRCAATCGWPLRPRRRASGPPCGSRSAPAASPAC